MPTMKQHEVKLRRAIQLAAEEHGVPNSFGFVELQRHYGAPPPMIAGSVPRRRVLRDPSPLREHRWTTS